jgi:hypothetical protein
MHTRAIFILEWKEGETGKQRERQRKRMCECGSIVGTFEDNWYDDLSYILHIILKTIMLNAVMLSFVNLSFTMLSVILLLVILLSFIMPIVVMLKI